MTNTQLNNQIRGEFLDKASMLEVGEFDFLGQTTEGMAYQDKNGKTVIVKVVVKADTFDLADAFDEFEEKQAAKEARETAAKAKRDAREAKEAEKALAKAKVVEEAKTEATVVDVITTEELAEDETGEVTTHSTDAALEL